MVSRAPKPGQAVTRNKRREKKHVQPVKWKLDIAQTKASQLAVFDCCLRVSHEMGWKWEPHGRMRRMLALRIRQERRNSTPRAFMGLAQAELARALSLNKKSAAERNRGTQ